MRYPPYAPTLDQHAVGVDLAFHLPYGCHVLCYWRLLP